MTKKVGYIFFGAFLLTNFLVAATNDIEPRVYMKTPVTEYGQVYELEQDFKSPFTFKRGDFKGVFGGALETEYYFYDNMYLLNHKVPDQIGAFKEKVDLNLDVTFGEKKYGHKAVEFYTDLRNKNKWGVLGSYKNATKAEVKIGDALIGEHDHKSTRPVPWFKDLWLAFSFNSALNLTTENIHYFKAGWFPFQLGNGIALGDSYGAVYEELGLYSYVSDASAPGIDVYGTLVKNKLTYDLYYAKFEDKSAAFTDVYNRIKENHINSHFWRGVAKDDELWAARLKYTPFTDKKGKYGRLGLEPYIYFDEASDQKVTYNNDCKSQLGAYGLSLEFKKTNFKFGGEIALNYGHEHLYEIDKNEAKIGTRNYYSNVPAANSEDLGGTYQYYSYVVYADDHSINAPINNWVKLAAAQNVLLPAGVPYPDAGHDENLLTNKANRIRLAYTNNFRGWMGVVSMAYKLQDYNLKLATEFAYASGDGDPHAQESDKNYKGFIGLHELFSGKKVKSMIVLGEREMPRPISLSAGQTDDAKMNKTFSDITYLGFAGIWKPVRFKEHKLRVNPNILFYWKNASSYKYDQEEGRASETQKARDFIGTELNLVANYELIKNLMLRGVFSIFFPGAFYKDMRGTKLKGIFDVDQATNPGNLDSSDYRLSSDRVIFCDFSVKYKF